MRQDQAEQWRKMQERVFNTLLAREGAQDVDKLLQQATAATNALYWQPFNRVLEKHQGIEAFRRILRLDGNSGTRYFDFLAGRYADKPDPLKAYGFDTPHGSTAGQDAIRLFYSKLSSEEAEVRKQAHEQLDETGDDLF